jgi:transcriptional regulator with XRE-family HTH domain
MPQNKTVNRILTRTYQACNPTHLFETNTMTKPTANDMDSQIGQRLKRGRQLVGLSAAALAEAIGSTQQQISRYENGQNKISAAQLYIIASHLGMPVSWFFLDLDSPAKVQLNANPDELREPLPPGYVVNRLGKEQLTKIQLAEDSIHLQVFWPRIPPHQRGALLQLMDSLVD